MSGAESDSPLDGEAVELSGLHVRVASRERHGRSLARGSFDGQGQRPRRPDCEPARAALGGREGERFAAAVDRGGRLRTECGVEDQRDADGGRRAEHLAHFDGRVPVAGIALVRSWLVRVPAEPEVALRALVYRPVQLVLVLGERELGAGELELRLGRLGALLLLDFAATVLEPCVLRPHLRRAVFVLRGLRLVVGLGVLTGDVDTLGLRLFEGFRCLGAQIDELLLDLLHLADRDDETVDVEARGALLAGLRVRVDVLLVDVRIHRDDVLLAEAGADLLCRSVGPLLEATVFECLDGIQRVRCIKDDALHARRRVLVLLAEVCIRRIAELVEPCFEPVELLLRREVLSLSDRPQN